jgi:hypothetical protein
LKDHHPSGAKHPRRRAIQLGLRGIESFVEGEDILEIRDISALVAEQHSVFKKQGVAELVTPKEDIYVVNDQEVAKKLGLL